MIRENLFFEEIVNANESKRSYHRTMEVVGARQSAGNRLANFASSRACRKNRNDCSKLVLLASSVVL